MKENSSAPRKNPLFLRALTSLYSYRRGEGNSRQGLTSNNNNSNENVIGAMWNKTYVDHSLMDRDSPGLISLFFSPAMPEKKDVLGIARM